MDRRDLGFRSDRAQLEQSPCALSLRHEDKNAAIEIRPCEHTSQAWQCDDPLAPKVVQPAPG